MHWLRSHPYLVSLSAAVILLILGTYIVAQRVAVPPQSAETLAWGGAGGYLFDPTASVPSYAGQAPQTIYEDVRGAAPFYYAEPPDISSEDTEAESDFDFDAFVALLSSSGNTGSKTGGASSGSLLLDTAYSLIPSGLISTSTPEKYQTPTQQALHSYGDEVGSNIQSFEDSFPNASRILKDQFEDKDDPEKNNALLALAAGLSAVGSALETMDRVPSEIATAHQKVATSYKELGEALARIPNGRDEQELVNMMLAYNATVETYVKNYVALATLFSVYDVTFTPDDPGSVFTFSAVSF